MRKIIYYISIFIILCIFGDSAINYSIAKQIDEQSPYYLSFASIGANLLESRLDSWAKIRSVRTFAEMDQELIKILMLLDLPVEEAKFIHQNNNGKSSLHYDLTYNNQSYFFTLQNDAEETYFLLTSISSKDDQKLRQEAQILEKALQCKLYFRYKGVVEARPGNAGREKLIHVLLNNLQAKQVDNYQDDNLTSITAFSPKMENQVETVELAGKRYNLQIVLRSDNTKNQSIVYLGCPLLLNDY